ncbi:uncharacterized protein EHS24_008531 [Apiotrichum porosum]|uniref:Stress-response A/B barrel domain-containing protein n=1 Tax=Apiotrichum porosum TaxID=105984 RepID=A0A427XQL5_9TREE|nr:uncharacterized protein EHS24_008531 [Apiotrichum porosum]RSH81097.1 hypothetical protein EHS24_008531 [Apiotrichum porosum]
MPTIGDVFNPNSKAITSRQRHIVLVTLGSLLVLSCLFFSIGIFHSDPPQTYPPGWEYSMTVLHIVAFKLTDTANLPALSEGMLALKHQCVRDGKPYIRSAVGGKQTNKEGHDGGMQVVYLVEFENQADADYYTDHDPAHIAFKNTLGGLGFAGVTVLDFTPGEF